MSLLSSILARATQGRVNCHEISAFCTIDKSIYGYWINLAATCLFISIFALSAAIHLIQGVRYRTWTFMTPMVLGGLMEAAGYASRIPMHFNPFASDAFKSQLFFLTVAPAFFSASIYVTLKHFVLVCGADLSPIKPWLYTWKFVTCDVISLVFQAVGAAMASVAKEQTGIGRGNNVMIFGLAFQVFTLAVFGIFALLFTLRVNKKGGLRTIPRIGTPGSVTMMRARLIIIALASAFTFIEIRCVYRVVELAGGWRNPIMQDEASFMVLDGAMCILATLALNAVHPGPIFRESKKSATQHPAT